MSDQPKPEDRVPVVITEINLPFRAVLKIVALVMAAEALILLPIAFLAWMVAATPADRSILLAAVILLVMVAAGVGGLFLWDRFRLRFH